jgi:hypothetical protein
LLLLSDLQNLINTKGRSNHDRTLLCLALDPVKNRSNSEICEIGKQAGWSGVASGTVATSLSRAKGLAIRTPTGWKLTEDGEAHVRSMAGTRQATKPAGAAVALRKHLANIKDADTLAFVEEAVRCYEHGLLRSAVVMSWVGAMSMLYRYIVANKLAEFNGEATRRNAKWKPAVTTDDLALMKEYDFLQVLQAISVIGKSVKTELEHCLDSRNGCGHPNSFKIADSKVAAHVEVLLLNVYEKF